MAHFQQWECWSHGEDGIYWDFSTIKLSLLQLMPCEESLKLRRSILPHISCSNFINYWCFVWMRLLPGGEFNGILFSHLFTGFHIKFYIKFLLFVFFIDSYQWKLVDSLTLEFMSLCFQVKWYCHTVLPFTKLLIQNGYYLITFIQRQDWQSHAA